MPPTPSQILEQLLKAIDKDAKVINMVGVLEAISCIENTQITKEALEETRLGKIVNDIRKNTNDKALSARCKKLVRVWNKQFVTGATARPPGSSTQDAPLNRQPTPPTRGSAPAADSRTPSLQAQTSTTPSSTSTVDRNKSENRKRRKPAGSPGTATPTGSATTSAKRPRLAVSTPTSYATKEQASLDIKNGIPAPKNKSPSNVQSSKSAFSKVKPSELKSSRTSSPTSKVKGASSASLSKLNSTNKVLRKSPITKQVPSPVNSIGSKRSSLSVAASKAAKLSPSVNVQHSSNSNVTDSSQRDQADFGVGGGVEAQTTDSLVSRRSRPQSKSPSVPESLQDSNSSSATVKLRSPARHGAVAITAAASPTTFKYDHVQPDELESLETADQEEPGPTSFSIFDDDYEEVEEEEDDQSDEVQGETIAQFDKGSTPSILTLSSDGDRPCAGDLHGVDTMDVGTAPNEDSPEESETPFDAERELEEEPAPRKVPTEEDIVRLHQQQWDGVNGCYSGDQREWFDWTQSLSVPIQDDDDNALHILPYICVD